MTSLWLKLIQLRYVYRINQNGEYDQSMIEAYQGSNFSSHTRKMQVKKVISEVVFFLLAFSRE